MSNLQKINPFTKAQNTGNNRPPSPNILDQKLWNSRYKIIKKIGAGSFGKVYMAEDTTTGTNIAIKQVSKTILETNEYLYQAFWKELDIMKLCECENSVKLFDHFESDGNHNIIMELCDTDWEIVWNKKVNGFSEGELRVLWFQLNKVFLKMQKENIIHRDWKLKNILVKYDQSIPEIGWIPKWSDFGFSKVMDEDITRTKLGTPATMAPEILMNKTYNKKVDLWSWGVISYQWLFKSLPYKARNERELWNVILNSKGIIIPENSGNKISELWFNLLQSWWQVDPKNRLDFNEYFNHKFFDINNSSGNTWPKYTQPSMIPTQLGDNNKLLSFEERFTSIRKLSDNFCDYCILKAKDKLTGEFVYLKEVLRSTIDSSTLNTSIFNKEIELWKKWKSDSFIDFIDYYSTSTHYIIVVKHFEGKILHNFLAERKSWSEAFVQKIIQSLRPGFWELMKNNIVLEYLSPKSFYFMYYNSEDDFKIKFFDYGLSVVFADKLEKNSFFWTEGQVGNITSQKTNVLSFGLIVFKCLFGENIYNFKENESPRETIEKQKTVKITKPISKSCKRFIEKTCHLQIEQRYDWQSLIDDSFVKSSNETWLKPSIKATNNTWNKLSDIALENIAEKIKSKIETITTYYTVYINAKSSEIEASTKYIKEMSIFAMLTMLELKMFLELIRNHEKESFFEDEELHWLSINLSTAKYSYSYINFLNDKILLNKENEVLDTFKNDWYKLEIKLKIVIQTFLKKIDINIDNMDSFDYLNNSMKNYYTGNIEKYFFKVFENAVLAYTKKEFQSAFDEFEISKYLLESIIFIRAILNQMKTSVPYIELINVFEGSDSKIKETEKQEVVILSIWGGIIKTFKSQNIIEEESGLSDEEQGEKEWSKGTVESWIEFYPDVIKLIKDCKEKVSNSGNNIDQ